MSTNSKLFDIKRFQNVTPIFFNIKYIKLLIEIAGFCHPSEPKKSLRMFVRSLFWRTESFAWFKYIANHSLLSQLVLIETNLPEKLHRQILRADYSIQKRLSILRDHYDLIEQVISLDLLEKALVGGGLELAVIDTSEQQYRLKLVYGAYPAKEGELSIVMLDAEGTPLIRLSFSLLRQGESYAIYIAGMQGVAGENAREKVAMASKSCYGLAPRRIVMEVLFAIAKHVKAKNILGVSDRFHISSKKLTKHFNYDGYWLAFEASLDINSDYVLPLEPKHKDYADTPRKRRAKYRRQHELLDFLNISTLTVLKINSG